MNERVSRVVLALSAMLIVVLVLGPGQQMTPRTAPLAASDAKDRYGFSAFSAWLSASGFAVASFRKRFRDLDVSHPGQGQVLILAAPMHRAIRQSDALALKSWLNNGNALLLTARHADAVSVDNVLRDLRSVGEALGFKVRARKPKQSEKQRAAAQKRFIERLDGELDDEEIVELTVLPSHSISRNVRSLNVRALKPTALSNRLSVASSNNAVALLMEHPTLGQLAWYVRGENSRVILLGLGGLGANVNLDRADNAQLLRNAVSYLASSKRVIFADYYQGRSDLYDPAALLRDPRLHISVLIMLALWLSYLVLVERRLLPTVNEPPKVPAHEIKGLSRLIGRHVSHAERADGLLAGAFSTSVLPGADRAALLHALALDPRVGQDDLRIVKQACAQALKTDIELTQLLAAIIRIERARRGDPK